LGHPGDSFCHYHFLTPKRPKNFTSLVSNCLLKISGAKPEPQENRSQNVQNRLIFGEAGNSAIAGAAIGAGAQYFWNSLTNPCANVNRNKSPNNKFFTGNQVIDNGAWGILAGFAGSSIANNLLGGNGPC